MSPRISRSAAIKSSCSLSTAFRKADLAARLGQKGISGQMNKIIREIVRQGLIEYTIPDKPNSHPQEYRLTEAGRRMLPGATQSAMPRKVR
jgi:ATP-dependent DNA helicase RecG